MPMTFVHPRLMRWNTNAITDHNRNPVAVSVEQIERKQRMANGTMRKYYVATKRTFATGWDMLPKPTTRTVDGFWGGSAIENFYNTTKVPFTLELTDADGTVTTYTVMFSDFTKEITKRGSVDLWAVTVTMEEV